MIEVIGTAEEVAEAVKAIAPTYPIDLIRHLYEGEWYFILNGIDVKAMIVEATHEAI